MKFIQCTECESDLLPLENSDEETPVSCACRKSSGYYRDCVTAVVQGPCEVIGVKNMVWLQRNDDWKHPSNQHLLSDPNTPHKHIIWE